MVTLMIGPSALFRRNITADLHRLGHEARLESADGYFYFLDLEPAARLDNSNQRLTYTSLLHVAYPHLLRPSGR